MQRKHCYIEEKFQYDHETAAIVYFGKMLEELTVKRSNLDRTAGKTEERISLTKQKIAENQANHVEKHYFMKNLGQTMQIYCQSGDRNMRNRQRVSLMHSSEIIICEGEKQTRH